MVLMLVEPVGGGKSLYGGSGPHSEMRSRSTLLRKFHSQPSCRVLVGDMKCRGAGHRRLDVPRSPREPQTYQPRSTQALPRHGVTISSFGALQRPIYFCFRINLFKVLKSLQLALCLTVVDLATEKGRLPHTQKGPDHFYYIIRPSKVIRMAVIQG
jgi:hypothetical protein